MTQNEIGAYFELKEESIGAPDIYLGGKLRKVELQNGIHAWAFGSSQCLQEVVQNVEEYLASKWEFLQKKAPSPLSNRYGSKIDVTAELVISDAAIYQIHIGILP